jgi:SAM-dependent methyltransferase
MTSPAIEITTALNGITPGRALDLACGAGRHAVWLLDRGWRVTAVDLAIEPIEGVTCLQADLEQGAFPIEPGAWDLVVCWLYWQENMLPSIAQGVRPGGIVALAGKTSGRFATSLSHYRKAFPGWEELSSGEDDRRTHFIAHRPESA